MHYHYFIPPTNPDDLGKDYLNYLSNPSPSIFLVHLLFSEALSDMCPFILRLLGLYCANFLSENGSLT